MSWQRPSPTQVWQAIETYLQLAYDHSLPSTVSVRIAALQSTTDDTFYQSDVFERDSAEEPSHFGLRLGNRFYPHAKLVISRAPDGCNALFLADTHDRHCCPDPSSPDYSKFRVLMEQNDQIAQQVEQAWAKQGLPTFRQLLRQDRDRRQSSVVAGDGRAKEAAPRR